VAAEQKSQESFDTTVLSLSGGALGISFVFLKDVIGTSPVHQPFFLLCAWICWALSSTSVLASYFLSHLGLRRAITQVDKGTIYEERAGGSFAFWTAFLNAAGAILFCCGVVAITLFANANLVTKGDSNDGRTTNTKASAASVTPAPAGHANP
jgi:hypothetical protein